MHTSCRVVRPKVRLSLGPRCSNCSPQRGRKSMRACGSQASLVTVRRHSIRRIQRCRCGVGRARAAHHRSTVIATICGSHNSFWTAYEKTVGSVFMQSNRTLVTYHVARIDMIWSPIFRFNGRAFMRESPRALPKGEPAVLTGLNSGLWVATCRVVGSCRSCFGPLNA
jgi:hypothetical protein